MNIKSQIFFSAINAATNSEIGTRHACMNEPKRNVTEYGMISFSKFCNKRERKDPRDESSVMNSSKNKKQNNVKQRSPSS